MTIPYVTESTTDGALGAVAGDASKTIAIIGPATLATANTVYAFKQPQDLLGTAGYGPASELAAQVLSRGEGKVTVLLVNPTTSAGTFGSVTQTGSGLATIVDNSSTPNDNRDIVIKIGLGGAVATATFQYSLDGGATYNGKEIATAASYTIPNTGVSVTMSSGPGNFVLGDKYAFSVTAPSYTTTQVGTAFDALAASGRSFSVVYPTGIPADTAAAVAMAAALDTKLASLRSTRSQYACGIVDGPSGVADATVIAGVASTTSSGGVVTLAADFVRLTSALSLRSEKRPVGWALATRIMPRPISEDAGRVKTGALPGVAKLKSETGDPVSYTYHNEFTSPGLDEARLTTARTGPGLSGVFLTQWVTLAPLGSDFALGQNRRVMDAALTAGHAAMLQYANDGVRVNSDGTIDERDALHIEADVGAKLRAALGSDVVDVSIAISRSEVILTTKKLPYRVRVLPLGYAKFIEGEYGFVSPASLIPA